MKNEFEKLHAMIDAANSFCELNHGPNTKQEDYPAVNSIIVPIGRKENDIVHMEEHNLSIPICQECFDGLKDPDWTLLYCLECCSNQWIYNKNSKLDYFNKNTKSRHDIIWLKGCPKCGGKFGGMYCEK